MSVREYSPALDRSYKKQMVLLQGHVEDRDHTLKQEPIYRQCEQLVCLVTVNKSPARQRVNNESPCKKA